MHCFIFQLVLVAAFAAASAAPTYVSPYGLHYPYAAPIAYNYQPVVYQHVPKEYEVEVKSFQYELVDTGCKNAFGYSVPCAAVTPVEKAAPVEVTPAVAEAVAPVEEVPVVEKTEA